MAIFRRTALVAFILLIATGAFAAENQVKETVLPNGLKVLIKEVHAAPVFTCQVWYKVGSRNEHPGITGISHLVEHMMFKGTKTYGKGEYHRIIRSKGGNNNASTWLDWTNYWEVLSSNHLELALKMESDRMQNALMDAKEFNAERVVILSEMEGRENDPSMLLYSNIQAVAYQTHPYRWPTIGYASDLKNITRSQLYNYYKTYYHPNNALLVIVGDVDTNKTLNLVCKYFGVIPKGSEPPRVYTTEPVQHGERRFVLRREGTAERTMIAYHMPDVSSPDFCPMLLLNQIFDGGKSTRLYQSMVEGQIAESTDVSSGFRKDPGLMILSATGRSGVTAAKLEKALLDEVEKAKTTLPTDEELDQAKRQFEAYLIYKNDSVSDQGESLGFYELETGSWKYLDMLFPKVKAVTAEDIQRVAKKYLTEDNRTVGWFVPTDSTSANEEQPTAAKTAAVKPEAVSSQAVKAAVSTKATTAPAVTAPKSPAPAKATGPKRVVLKNGLVLIVQENHSNPTLAISGSIRAGGYFNPPSNKKIASFVTSMLSRGTTTRSALDLAADIDKVAADISFSSDDEAVRFSGGSISRDFDLLMNVLSDQIRNPSFPQAQLDKLKGAALTSLDMEKEDPESRAYRELCRSIYPEGHPARPQSIDEDKKSIQAITRDDLIAFHDKYYSPETTVLVIVGDVTPKEATAMVEKYFGDWQPTGTSSKIELPDLSLAKGESRNIIELPDKSQVDVMFGHAGQVRRSDPDFYAVTIMNNILGGGGGMNSKLGLKIRDEMGLVYSIYSWFDTGLGEGPFFGGFGSNPANVDKAIATTDQVIRDYIKNGPTQQEFNDAVEYITGVFPIRLETNDGVAGILNAAEFYNLGMDYIQKYTSYYRAVTIDQVRQAAKKYLHPDNMTVVIAGSYKNKDQK